MSKPLWAHQEQAIKAAQIVDDLALFFDMGTGKSRTIVEILRRNYAINGRLRRTIILAPIVVCENWKNEFKMYSKIRHDDIVILTGTGKKRVKEFKYQVGEDLSGSKIIVTNYESMDMSELFELLHKWSPEILVCDESQRLKNPDSKRAKKVSSLADITRHNYILTGTPILNNPMDLYMQFRILDRGQTFGVNQYVYRAKYMYDANEKRKGSQSYFPKWEPRQDCYDVLQKNIAAKSLRVLKKDCLDLPPLVRQTIDVELSTEQKKMYKEMFNEYITFIQNEQQKGTGAAVVAQLAITKALRLRQIVTGFVKDEEGNMHRIKCPRLDELAELLEDLAPQHKIIVWAEFKENYKMIAELCDKLKIKHTMLNGDQTAKEKNSSMNDFRQNPETRVMIANQSAGGVGVNLIEASYSIYYSRSYKLEDDLQSEARNYRGGSEMHEKITRIDLVAKGTIDELILETLANKMSISEAILSWKDKLCRF